jgi:hypothetical protein
MRLNVDTIEFMVQGVLVILPKIMSRKCYVLPQIEIMKPPTMRFLESVNLCFQMAPLGAFVQKEGWKVSQFKGKYVAKLLALI